MFIEDTITGQLVIVLPLCLGQWSTGFALLLSLSLDWYGAVGVDVSYTLVAAVCYGVGALLEVYFGILV